MEKILDRSVSQQNEWNVNVRKKMWKILGTKSTELLSVIEVTGMGSMKNSIEEGMK